jgi:hypothetical protein
MDENDELERMRKEAVVVLLWIQLVRGKVHLAVSCEHSNKSLSFLKSEEFIDNLSDYQLLKKNFVPWSRN